MKKKNLNYIAALEKAIRKKYGEIAIQNPANSWTPEGKGIFIPTAGEY